MLHRLVVGALPLVPGGIMRRIAGRYIAGETLAEAIERLKQLAREGYSGMLDLLGENVANADQARAAAAAYAKGADALTAAGLDAYVSVKPTHFGLLLDPRLALDLYRALAEHCRAQGRFVRVEMEDRSTTDATLELFEALRRDFGNVGIVLQARLFRTPADIDALAPGPLDVRMVKGIYLEPSTVAHTDADAIRDAFIECSTKLFARNARVGFATHDQGLGERVVELVRAAGKSVDDYEFQVLMGVQEPLWRIWRQAGHAVRVYVPYGPEWRPYSQRRLKHNPELFRAVLKNMLAPRA